jgi:hypothetical protein
MQKLTNNERIIMIYVPENPVVSIDPVVLVPVFPGFPN